MALWFKTQADPDPLHRLAINRFQKALEISNQLKCRKLLLRESLRSQQSFLPNSSIRRLYQNRKAEANQKSYHKTKRPKIL
jgi:hypothetical protein